MDGSTFRRDLGYQGSRELDVEGKIKACKYLFQRTAVRDGDATTFAAADVRLPAQICEV